MKVESLDGVPGGVKDINDKARKLKKDAEDLLNKAKSGIRQLDSKCASVLSVLTAFFRGLLLWPLCTTRL